MANFETHPTNDGGSFDAKQRIISLLSPFLTGNPWVNDRLLWVQLTKGLHDQIMPSDIEDIRSEYMELAMKRKNPGEQEIESLKALLDALSTPWQQDDFSFDPQRWGQVDYNRRRQESGENLPEFTKLEPFITSGLIWADRRQNSRYVIDPTWLQLLKNK